MNNLIALIDSFYKRAGTLFYPHKTFNKVMSHINEAINYYLSPQNPNREPIIIKGVMDIDFEGLPNQYNPKIMKQIVPPQSEIEIIIMDSSDLSSIQPINRWIPGKITLTVVLDNDQLDRADIEEKVSHELSHMTQTIIENYIARKNQSIRSQEQLMRSKPGIPSEWRAKQLPEEVYPSYGIGGEKYFSTGIEFFPFLNGLIHKQIKSGKVTKYDFKTLIENNPFFVSLERRNKDMYERAVGEAWKILSNNLDRSPDKEMEAKSQNKAYKEFRKIENDIINIANEIGNSTLDDLHEIPKSEYPPGLLKFIEMKLKDFNIKSSPNDIKLYINMRNQTVNLFTVQNGKPIVLHSFLGPESIVPGAEQDMIYGEVNKLNFEAHHMDLLLLMDKFGLNKKISIHSAPHFLSEMIDNALSISRLPPASRFMFKQKGKHNFGLYAFITDPNTGNLVGPILIGTIKSSLSNKNIK